MRQVGCEDSGVGFALGEGAGGIERGEECAEVKKGKDWGGEIESEKS